MALTPIFDRSLPATADVRGRLGYDWLGLVVIKGTLLGEGTLGIVAGVVFVVCTGGT